MDEANAQARGLGNMVAFWERMRNICPKVNSYDGPVYGKEGKQCVTSLDLDEAKSFSFMIPSPSTSSLLTLRNKSVHEQLCSLSSRQTMSSLAPAIGLE